MTVNRYIKRNAKNALRGQWSKGFAAALILLTIGIVLTLLETTINNILATDAYTALLGRFGIVQWLVAHGIYEMVMSYSVLLVMSALEFMIAIPFVFGLVKWSYAVASGNPCPIALLFYYYTGIKKYFKSLAVALRVVVRILCYGLLFNLPAIIVYGLAVFYATGTGYIEYLYLVMLGVSALLAFAGIGVALVVSMKYMIVFYLFIDDPGVKIKDAIGQSNETMKQHKRNAFSLVFSFLPLLILCIACFPILFVLPYLAVSLAIFSKYLVEKQK